MANVALSTTQTETLSPYMRPNGQFGVIVYGTINGNIFLQIGSEDQDLTNDSNWANVGVSFDDENRSRSFVALKGFVYRIQAANAGSLVLWGYAIDTGQNR